MTQFIVRRVFLGIGAGLIARGDFCLTLGIYFLGLFLSELSEE
jgi:hypothetical protein